MNLKNLQEEYKEYEEESYLPTVEETEIQALNLAMETIEKLSGNISHHVGAKLRERTSQLRMAAGELFCEEESFPVILDDVFGMYDEDRLAAVLRWMHKEQKQIIISTCHKREMEILDREGIPYQKLLLS